MKTFKQFNLESQQYVDEGLKKNIITRGLKLAGRVFDSKPARIYYGGQAIYDTSKSIANKEPWYQTASKAMTGFFAKKGSWKRGTAGIVGQTLLPGDKSAK